MKQIILFGTKQFPRLIKEYIERFTDDKVAAFCCNKEFIDVEEIDTLPVVALEEVEKHYSPDRFLVLPTVGYTKMNSLRKTIVNIFRDKGYSFYSFIHPTATIYGDKIGEGNIILEQVNIGMHTEFGSFNMVFNGCQLSHHGKIGDYNHFSPAVALGGNVTIKDRCFFGINSTIRDSIVIEEATLVGAGCYINKSTTKGAVITPAATIHRTKNSEEFI